VASATALATAAGLVVPTSPDDLAGVRWQKVPGRPWPSQDPICLVVEALPAVAEAVLALAAALVLELAPDDSAGVSGSANVAPQSL